MENWRKQKARKGAETSLYGPVPFCRIIVKALRETIEGAILSELFKNGIVYNAHGEI